MAPKFYAGMSCQHATVSCSGAADLGVTFGNISPSSPTGTIVMFSGSGGTAPTEDGDNIPVYASAYAAQYEIVELEWDSAWQDPSNGNGGSFLTAACRPATFLNYVNTALNPKNLTCAQGSSMGTAAIGYAMAWYGAASYLKAAELIAGPPASEIDVGCNPASPGPVTICGSGNGYCTLKTAPWTDRVTYPPIHASIISMWSGLPTPVCASNGVTQSELQQWAAMSIVDGSSSGYNPTFNYNATTIHGWLCTDTYTTCTGQNCPNNTSAQGKLFYDAVLGAEGGSSNLLLVTGTQNCTSAEGVDFGIDPDSGVTSTRKLRKRWWLVASLHNRKIKTVFATAEVNNTERGAVRRIHQRFSC